MTETHYIGDFGNRTVLISDKGHKIESNIIDMIKVELFNYTLQILNKYTPEFPPAFPEAPPEYTNRQELIFHTDQLKRINQLIPLTIPKIENEMKTKNDQLKEFSAIDRNEDKKDFIKGVLGPEAVKKKLEAYAKDATRRNRDLDDRDYNE